MEEDGQVAWRRTGSVADIMEFETIAQGVEVVLEARQWLFGQVPKSISFCMLVSRPSSNGFGSGHTDRELQLVLLRIFLEESSILDEQP
jgi:hypothetical protein